MGALQFDEKLLNLAGECERELGDSFSRIRETELITGTRVVSAFIENSVMINHLSGSTGYGYGDIGRDKLDAVFAQSLMAEDALVRHTFVSVVKTLPAGEVKQLVGHSQDMDTFGIYGHTLTGDDETTAQAVNGVFLRVLKNAQ